MALSATERGRRFYREFFSRAGLRPRRDTYEIRGQACHNIETEISGASPEIILIGAHYDSVFGSPGANDNGSGVAAMLALARRFAGKTRKHTLRFVAFVNEEPPYFLSDEMGSFIYAGRCKARGDKIPVMISLETIGYFSDAPNSQTYPSPGLGIFYPKVGNFIGFVGNVRSRSLLRRVIAAFRKHAKISSEGAALPAFIPGVSWSDQRSFWRLRLSRHYGHRHRAVSLSLLSFCRRHAGQTRLRSVRACGERHGESDRGSG